MQARKCISDMQKELQFANTRCGNLRSQLDYMKMVFHHVHPELDCSSARGHPFDRPDDVISEASASPTREEIDKIVESISSGNRSIACSQEYQNAFQEPTESPRNSPRMNYTQDDFLSGQNEIEDIRVEAVDLSMPDPKDPEITGPAPRSGQTPQNFILPKSNETSPRHRENTPQDKSDASEQFVHEESQSYWQEPQQHILNLPLSLNNVVKERQLSPKQDSQKRSSAPVNIEIRRNTEILTSRSVRKDVKRNNVSIGLGQSKKVLPAKADDSLTFKIRRKKGKLRSSTSKSTVATRDTSYVKKKDNKKKRVTNVAIKGRKNSETKPSSTCNEVVEIFNNSSAQNASNPVIPGLRSKSSKSADHASSTSVFVNDCGTTQPRSKYTANNLPPQSPTVKNDKWVFNEKADVQAVTAKLPANAGCSRCQHAVVQTAYYNAANYRNYEMPTLSSNQKKVDRSYFSRFHFRNIPFVVGTSVTPSHNLGLNIQQVLSILKAKQPPVSGTAPFLIRKVSRGMEPISVLMERMRNHPNVLLTAMDSGGKQITSSSPTIGIAHNTPTLTDQSHSVINPSTTVLLSNNRQFGPFPGENGGQTDKLLEGNLGTNPSADASKISQNDSSIYTSNNGAPLKPFTSQQYIKSHPRFSSIYIKDPQIMSADNFYSSHSQNENIQQENTRGIREVLSKLHDQFETLNTRYEELQEKMEKTSDEKLATEISSLEAELNAKEDEINAVVGLYKEVMSLKQEMKLLQEKNSLVCISAEITGKPKKAYYPGAPLRLDRSYASKRGNPYTAARAPSASVRLAALLRQIQVFQKQLQSEFS